MIKELYKDYENVYIVDIDGREINIGDMRNISKYEKINNVKIDEELIEFLDSQDKKSKYSCGIKDILLDIKSIAERNNVDYFVYGRNLGEDDNTICLSFIINNRISNMDGEIRVFHEENSIKKISVEIILSQGTSGDNYGYSFYRYFDHSDYTLSVKKLIEKYLKDKACKDEDDLEIINTFMTNIKEHIR